MTATGGAVRQRRDHRCTACNQDLFSEDSFQPTRNTSAPRGAWKTLSLQRQPNGPLDGHKMADNCASSARTSTLFSKITKLIKSLKTSNESWSHNCLNHVKRMYKHELFDLQQAWLVPVYKQIRTTKSLPTPCTKYPCWQELHQNKVHARTVKMAQSNYYTTFCVRSNTLKV